MPSVPPPGWAGGGAVAHASTLTGAAAPPEMTAPESGSACQRRPPSRRPLPAPPSVYLSRHIALLIG